MMSIVDFFSIHFENKRKILIYLNLHISSVMLIKAWFYFLVSFSDRFYQKKNILIKAWFFIFVGKIFMSNFRRFGGLQKIQKLWRFMTQKEDANSTLER